jgi:WD40 repeat protein
VADVPETCAAIIRKAMAKDRSHRYANAEELHADLNLVMAEAGTSDPRQPSKPPAIVWPKKDLKDLPDSLSFAEMYPGERTAPVTPRRRLKRSIVLTGVIMLVTLVLTAVLFVRRESPEREPVSAVVASMDSATLAGEIDLAIRRRDVPEMKKALDRVQRTLKSAEASLPGARDSLRRAATRIEKAIEFRERIIEGGFALGLDGAVTSLRVSPKDDWIVVGQTHGSAGAIVFDFHTGETRHALWPRRGNGMARVHGLAVTHDNSTIAAACADNRVRFWNVGSGKESSFYLGQGVTLAQAVAFSPTARTVVVGLEPIGEGKGRPYVKSWNLDNNREPFTFKMEHSAKVWTVDFTAGGHQVATGSDDQRVVFWNATNGRIWREIRTGMAIRAIACDPRGRIIAVAGRKDSESCLQFWDYAAEQQLASRIVPHGNCDCVAFSRNGKLLAAGSGSRILLWNPETQTVAATLTGQAQNVTALAFSADGTILVSGGEDKMVRFWDVARCLSRPIPP